METQVQRKTGEKKRYPGGQPNVRNCHSSTEKESWLWSSFKCQYTAWETNVSYKTARSQGLLLLASEEYSCVMKGHKLFRKGSLVRPGEVG